MSALDEHLRSASAAVREQMEQVAIPAVVSETRAAGARRPAVLALVGAAALVVVISVVVAFGSRDRSKPQAPDTGPESIAAAYALAASDLPTGWKAEPFVQNAPGACLPSFTNTALDQAARQFDGPSGETLQEIVAYEPDDARPEFDLASGAMLRCSSKPTDLPAIGDESGAYFVSPVRAPTANPGDENLDAAVALVRLGGLRIDVIVFRHGIDEHILEALLRTAVDKIVVAQALKPCRLGDLAFDYGDGRGATGNDFGMIRIRNTVGRPCLLKGPIAVTGTDRNGRAVTQALTYPVATALVLTERQVVGDLALAAEYRDDTSGSATNRLCTEHEVVPATWRLTMPDGVRTVANASKPPSEFSSLITCRGRLEAPETITSESDTEPVSGPPTSSGS
jgi:hypothetical protein